MSGTRRPIDLVESYMKAFFGEAPLQTMRALFADDLVFEGPFHRSTTAEEYLDSLMEDPPREVSYVLEKTYQDDDSVCLVYIFSRPGVTTRMAQTFEIADGKICRIKLVFDSNAFK